MNNEITVFASLYGEVGEHIIKNRLVKKGWAFTEHHDADKRGAHSVDFLVNNNHQEFFLEVKTAAHKNFNGISAFFIKSDSERGAGYAGSAFTANQEDLPLVLVVVSYRDRCIYWEYDCVLQQHFYADGKIFPCHTDATIIFHPKQFTHTCELTAEEISLFDYLKANKHLPPEITPTAYAPKNFENANAIAQRNKFPDTENVTQVRVPDIISPIKDASIDLLRREGDFSKIYVKQARIMSAYSGKNSPDSQFKKAVQSLHVEPCKLKAPRLSGKPNYGTNPICLDVRDVPKILNQTAEFYWTSDASSPQADIFRRIRKLERWFEQVIIPYCDALIESPALPESVLFSLQEKFEHEQMHCSAARRRAVDLRERMWTYEAFETTY